MKQAFRILAAVIFVSAIPSRVAAQAPLQRVIITYSSRSIASIDLYVAQERGFFHEEGLDPQLVQAFATNGIPGDEEIRAYLKMDAQMLGLPAPVPPSKVFDFSLQREVNQELGLK